MSFFGTTAQTDFCKFSHNGLLLWLVFAYLLSVFDFITVVKFCKSVYTFPNCRPKVFSLLNVFLIPDIFNRQSTCLFVGDCFNTADKVIAINQRQNVEPVFPFDGGSIDFPSVIKIEQGANKFPVPHHTVKRCDQFAAGFEFIIFLNGLDK